ncbi:hypothetical protein UCRPC4_g04792 [Phaeomoniella chlamydospora]|uniref:Uncharacterized protein n=1 Tax=Phaeomoniella chlamydospora TaxID=158046 RepID=A0A0G2E712_PHACM|nr:hypothetical protein UCRPC4_g04792 [Phaeomoniella chlamydospora]
MSSDGGYPVLREETGGMGNLADELADAWGEEDMDQSGVYLGNVEEHISEADSAYDGSDYGDQSDLELEEGISPTLAARIADIEALGRLGKGDTGFEGDEVIQRTICSLRDLGAQSGIENGASRLMTAHASLSSHLSHQTRTIQTLTHSIIKTPFPDLDTPSLDQLISMTSDLLPLLPFPPQPSPLQSLQLLISSTAEITHLLRALSDTLQESRLVTNTASRRLKTVKDMVSDLRKEEEERDFGSAWIERGNWDEKLRNRDAKKICGEVVSGFESTCDTWRERLIGGAVGA